MQDFPPLAELQRLLSDLIRAPEGVDKGLRDMVSRGELARADLSFAIESDGRMRPEERLDVYAGMYFYRLLDCLAEDHPRTRARIGAARFHNLVTDYLLAHPPSKPSLREAGAELAPFLRGHPLGERYAALADVAQLERARMEIFDARDARVLSRERFMQATGEDPEGFKLHLVPACRLVEIDARALGFWQEPTGDFEGAPAERVDVFVFRKGFDVLHRPCVEDEAHCLREIAQRGITLPDLAERLLKHDAGAEQTSERFAALLELWLHNEVLADPRDRPGA